MKIEKLHDVLQHDSHLVELTLKDKINEIIELLICPKCENVKGLVGPGLCFDCDKEKKH